MRSCFYKTYKKQIFVVVSFLYVLVKHASSNLVQHRTTLTFSNISV